jgi:hypothetical protein
VLSKEGIQHKSPYEEEGKLEAAGIIGRRWSVMMTLGGIPCNALLDTGASKTLLRYKDFNKLCEVTGRPRLLRSTNKMYSISGQSLDVKGATEVWIPEINSSLEVLVTDGIQHHLVLGDDALMKGKSLIDYPRGQLRWFGHQFKLMRYSGTFTAAGLREQPATGVASIDRVIMDNSDLFSEEGDPHGYCDWTKLSIDTGDAAPIRQRPYRVPLSKRKVISEHIDEMLKAGVIRPSCSPWASPVCLAPKVSRTGEPKYRFCCDFRRLNDVTVKDSYPLPLVQDIFDNLGGSSIYSTIDMKSGFWQLGVRRRTYLRQHL